ncbi:hypothetical protein OPQ81_008058 [Rhizoctonia solani]|nr:hypothetical protein OPQ81_008058 [Rhizoctonia solani]
MYLLSYLGYFLGGYTALTTALYALSAISSKGGLPPPAAWRPTCRSSSARRRCRRVRRPRRPGPQADITMGHGALLQVRHGRDHGVTFEVIDPNGYLDRTRPAVFIGNHQTELDVLMLGCMFPKYCSGRPEEQPEEDPSWAGS